MVERMKIGRLIQMMTMKMLTLVKMQMENPYRWSLRQKLRQLTMVTTGLTMIDY